jgi:RNA polymerase sigma-70 factor (ECF subfamily)
VRGYAARRAGLQEADEVVAEVFLIAWRRIDDLPEDPLPWLLGVARRVLANRQRSELRRAAMHGQLLAAAARSPQEIGPRLDDGAVAAALARLDDRDREVLLLTAWEGLRPAEVTCV